METHFDWFSMKRRAMNHLHFINNSRNCCSYLILNISTILPPVFLKVKFADFCCFMLLWALNERCCYVRDMEVISLWGFKLFNRKFDLDGDVRFWEVYIVELENVEFDGFGINISHGGLGIWRSDGSKLWKLCDWNISWLSGWCCTFPDGCDKFY